MIFFLAPAGPRLDRLLSTSSLTSCSPCSTTRQSCFSCRKKESPFMAQWLSPWLLPHYQVFLQQQPPRPLSLIDREFVYLTYKSYSLKQSTIWLQKLKTKLLKVIEFVLLIKLPMSFNVSSSSSGSFIQIDFAKLITLPCLIVNADLIRLQYPSTNRKNNG